MLKENYNWLLLVEPLTFLDLKSIWDFENILDNHHGHVLIPSCLISTRMELKRGKKKRKTKRMNEKNTKIQDA